MKSIDKKFRLRSSQLREIMSRVSDKLIDHVGEEIEEQVMQRAPMRSAAWEIHQRLGWPPPP